MWVANVAVVNICNIFIKVVVFEMSHPLLLILKNCRFILKCENIIFINFVFQFLASCIEANVFLLIKIQTNSLLIEIINKDTDIIHSFPFIKTQKNKRLKLEKIWIVIIIIR